MVVEKKDNQDKVNGGKDCLPNLSKKLVHAGDCNKNNNLTASKSSSDEKELATMHLLKPKRGRKARAIDPELDFTGSEPVLALETKKDTNNDLVDIVHESAREPVGECENTAVRNNSISKQEFADM
ncbi:11571_t:CDS:2, partial [Paraglomus brasilianum]